MKQIFKVRTFNELENSCGGEFKDVFLSELNMNIDFYLTWK